MRRFVRIVVALIIATAMAGMVRKALDLEPGFLAEICDIGLILVAMLLTSLSDRELFWGTTPKQRRRRTAA